MIRAPLGLAAALVVLTFAAHAQQPRDAVRPRPSGDASIRGVVTAKGSDPQPLRRARVTITGLDVDYTDTVITADDGTFGFERLPAGSYTLRGAKEPFVATGAGASRPGGLGATITVSGGERRRVDLQLPRGGVITGRVHAPDGEPAPGVIVTALANRYQPSLGERRLAQTGVTATTDDRGEYRIYGLPPGEYLVAAPPTRGTTSGLQVLTDAEIREALAQTARSLWSGVRPGATSEPPRQTAALPPPRATVGYAQIFHPGTPFLDRAVLVRLGEGESRTAVDIDLVHVPLATVDGAISVPMGAERVQITLTRATDDGGMETARFASADAGGRFTFRAVPPGQYRVVARTLPARVGPGTPGTSHVGTADIVVNGDDIAGLSIPLQPALSISGRLVFDPPIDALPLRAVPWIPLVAADVAGASVVPGVTMDGDSFTVTGIVPARYRFASAPQGIRTPIGRWWLKSALVGGREVLDEPLELRASAADAVLQWSERASELSGTVRSTGGATARDAWVVVFAREPRAWFLHSRRVAGVRPSADGSYILRNLPPGDYLAIAVREIDQYEWFDPELLGELAGQATPVRIVGDGRHTADLVVTR
jgi:hypothetical protein